MGYVLSGWVQLKCEQFLRDLDLPELRMRALKAVVDAAEQRGQLTVEVTLEAYRDELFARFRSLFWVPVAAQMVTTIDVASACHEVAEQAMAEFVAQGILRRLNAAGGTYTPTDEYVKASILG